MQTKLKYQAAQKALSYVKNGMVLGLGTGTTAEVFIKLLADQLKKNAFKKISAVPTSKKTAVLARRLGISLTTLDSCKQLDLAIDGADQVDENLNLIKGLGHALLREKIVAVNSRQLIIIVDESKITKQLGLNCPLPIEIAPFGAQANMRWLETLGYKVELLKKKGKYIFTDNNNYLAHCFLKKGIVNPGKLAWILEARPGIIEHGFFLGMANRVIVGGKDGVKVLSKRVQYSL